MKQRLNAPSPTHDAWEFDESTTLESDAIEAAVLDASLAAVLRDALTVDDMAIPREMMWARVRPKRVGAPPKRFPVSRTIVTRLIAVAATLLVGVAIGRYGISGSASERGRHAAVATEAKTAVHAVEALSTEYAVAHASDPAVIAMEEHLARTVALLVTVRDESPLTRPASDVAGWARELLGTTRLLLDEPQLRDDRTRRLLQDLELVLVQIVQARGTAAPEARRAPSETMRETNLLPRVRAAATASSNSEETTLTGIAE